MLLSFATLFAQYADRFQFLLFQSWPVSSSIWCFSLYALLACFDLKGCIAFASNFQDSLDLNVKEPFELHQPSVLPVVQMQLEQRTRRGGRVRSQGVG